MKLKTTAMLLTVMMLILCFLSACDSSDTDKEKADTVQLKTFEPDDGRKGETIYKDGNLHKKIIYDEDSVIAEMYEYEYDSDGNKIGETYYDKNGISRVTEYNSDGSWVYTDYENGIITEVSEHKNNYYRNKRTLYDKGGNITDVYEYDEQANIIKHSAYMENSLSSVKEYDKHGNVNKFTAYNGDGNIAYSREYEYDSNGNILNLVWLDGNGDILSEVVYEYDENGNMIKVTGYDKKGDINYQTEYDKNGETIKSYSKTPMECY